MVPNLRGAETVTDEFIYLAYPISKA